MKTVETRSKCRDHIVHIIYDDTVDHVLHLDKLKVYGFASEKMKWFQLCLRHGAYETWDSSGQGTRPLGFHSFY